MTALVRIGKLGKLAGLALGGSSLTPDGSALMYILSDLDSQTFVVRRTVHNRNGLIFTIANQCVNRLGTVIDLIDDVFSIIGTTTFMYMTPIACFNRNGTLVLLSKPVANASGTLINVT